MGAALYEKLVPSGSTESFDLEANDDASIPVSELGTSSEQIMSRGFRLDPRFISDAVLGLSDGMTVPFALTAGLSELGDARVVVLAGLAELVAGAISMGLGGYLGAKSEKEIYVESLANTERELKSSSHAITFLRIKSTFSAYSIPPTLLNDLASSIGASTYLPSFLLRFEQNLDEPADSRAIRCAMTIAAGYFIGGFIPLLPYLLVERQKVGAALMASVITMVVTLFLLGYGKAILICTGVGSTVSISGADNRRTRLRNVVKGLKGGFQMLAIGGVSAGCAVGLVKGFNSLL